MCQTARNVATGKEIRCMGDVRKIAQDLVFYAPGWEDSAAALPDEACLCPVELGPTLLFAKYKVWLNPAVVPEYLFEPVEERV